MNNQDYICANLASWNEAAGVHQRIIDEELSRAVQKPDYNNLNPPLKSLLEKIDVTGRSCIQVCCNKGVDLLSIRNMGAARCVGVDGAENFIAQAKKYASLAGQDDMEFLVSDVYALPETLTGQFDIVVTTVGVLNWMPDLPEFFLVLSSLIATDGHLLVEDMHPILNMYEEGTPSYLHYSYFDTGPHRDDSGLDYYTGEKYDAKPNFWFQHTISAILNAAIQANLTMRSIEELPYDISSVCQDLELVDCNPPMGFTAHWQPAMIA